MKNGMSTREYMRSEASKRRKEILDLGGKRAALTSTIVENGYTEFIIEYSTGGTHKRYLSPENINQDHDLRNEMAAWAEDRGFTVTLA